MKPKEDESSCSMNCKQSCMVAVLRLQRELCENKCIEDCELSFPDKDNLLKAVVDVRPKHGFYSLGNFKFTIDIPTDYPFLPPKVRSVYTVFHPNIDISGAVCLNILRQDWNPVLGLNHIIIGLLNIFLEPSHIEPLNKEAAELLERDCNSFRQVVQDTMEGKEYMGHTYSRVY